MRLSRRSLADRAERAHAILSSCTLCPRNCRVDRIAGRKGYCKATSALEVSSYNPHHGEEPPLSGTRGSGTIFLTHCTMRCVYCQNYPISQIGHGNSTTVKRLSAMMLELQSQGCHNINFVTPTHYVAQILAGLVLAVDQGLNIPIVYNTSGYESLETLRLLEEVVDIYLPDMRYADKEKALLYSDASDYPEINRAAIKEMHRQVGDLVLDDEGIAVRGVLIRHLVLPEDIGGTHQILKFIAKEISKNSYISLMNQYFPAHKAVDIPPLDRRITLLEYEKAKAKMKRLGLTNGWTQQ